MRKLVELRGKTGTDKTLTGPRSVNRKRLIDILNYINFQTGTILVNLRHKHYGSHLSLPAHPQPCTDGSLRCTWASPVGISDIGSSYAFVNFTIDRDTGLVLVDGELLVMDEEGIVISLPDHCSEFGFRKAKRYGCKDVEAELMQNGVLFHGRLLEFSCLALAVELIVEPPQTFQWIAPDRPVYVVFRKNREVAYTGECCVIRRSEDRKRMIIVLEPSPGKISRFMRESYDEPDCMLSPLPSVVFRHPLSERMVNFDLSCLSASSFTVEENLEDSSLFPGLVIPSVSLEFVPGFSIRCNAQVVARNLDNAQQTVEHTLVILDMSVEDQRALSALLDKAMNKKSYVGNRVDSDALWKFFFEAGFVYPKKYAALQAQRERFRNLYEKLYLESPTVARHFIHQDKGAILGHISMIRFYRNTWLIHHHAAIGQSAAGISVLKQIGRYIDDYRFLYSSHLDFVMCYFRPQNKFPNRVFGEFAKTFNNLKVCSVDAFAYLSFKSAEYALTGQPEGAWELNEARAEDLIELKQYYEFTSGGLMLNALDLEPDVDVDHLNDLSAEYEQLGFKRGCYLFSLRCSGRTKAFFMVVVSDVGLNMSNLTNCIHVIIMDPEDLSWDVLSSYLAQLSRYYEDGEIPLLIYPSNYLDRQQIMPEKIYNLWAFDCRYTEHFLEYVKSLLRREVAEGGKQHHG